MPETADNQGSVRRGSNAFRKNARSRERDLGDGLRGIGSRRDEDQRSSAECIFIEWLHGDVSRIVDNSILERQGTAY